MSDEKSMTPGEAFAAIVVTFGIDGCEERDLDPDILTHVPTLVERGFLLRDLGSVKPDLDKLADVIVAGARAVIDGGADAR